MLPKELNDSRLQRRDLNVKRAVRELELDFHRAEIGQPAQLLVGLDLMVSFGVRTCSTVLHEAAILQRQLLKMKMHKTGPHTWSWPGSTSVGAWKFGQKWREMIFGWTTDCRVEAQCSRVSEGSPKDRPNRAHAGRRLDPLVNSLRVGQIFKHDLADLERCLAEAELKDLDSADL